MSMPHEVMGLGDQLQAVVGLVQAGQAVAAAAALGALRWLDREHGRCVLVELERGHTDNALAALDLIRAIYCPVPRLRLVLGGESGAISERMPSRNSDASAGVTVEN